MTELTVEQLITALNQTIAKHDHGNRWSEILEVLSELVRNLHPLEDRATSLDQISVSSESIILHNADNQPVWLRQAVHLFNTQIANSGMEIHQVLHAWQWYELGARKAFENLEPSLPGVFEDVLNERQRQKRIGWTPEHDDQHGYQHLLDLVAERLNVDRIEVSPSINRHELIESAALIIAAVELGDRQVAALRNITNGRYPLDGRDVQPDAVVDKSGIHIHPESKFARRPVKDSPQA